MRLINGKGESFGVRVHGKKPSYFDGSERRRKVTVDGKPAEMVLHPKKSGDRVNFAGPKDTWLYVDNQALWDAIAKGTAVLAFTTAEGRAAKPAKEEADKAATVAA